MASDYSSDDNFYGEDDEEEEVAVIVLTPCSNCGRNFNPDVLARHSNVCNKVKPRKAFDSSKQRLAEIAKVPIVKPAPSTTPKNVGTKKPKKKDWRWQHKEFIKNIRAARGGNTGDAGGGSSAPSAPSYNPDYIQCPHCMRRFSESAADRHIDFCKEQKSRIPKNKDSKFADSKEKMDKRSTYKPPLPGKKKSIEKTPVKARKNSNSAPANPRVKGKASPAAGGHNNAPANPREKGKASPAAGGHNNAPANPRVKGKASPTAGGHNNSFGERAIKSDTSIAGRRKKPEGTPDDRQEQVTNSRYSKTHSANSRLPSGGSMSDNDSPKGRSAKSRGAAGEPKWFEDLKRNDSGNQLRKNKLQDDLDMVDSGLDINENYPRTTLASKNTKESPVGVVRPSSRTKESEFVLEKGERTVNSGRRKMANFCHDCGTRYPVTEAKFCCECGVKRMALA